MKILCENELAYHQLILTENWKQKLALLVATGSLAIGSTIGINALYQSYKETEAYEEKIESVLRDANPDEYRKYVKLKNTTITTMIPMSRWDYATKTATVVMTPVTSTTPEFEPYRNAIISKYKIERPVM